MTNITDSSIELGTLKSQQNDLSEIELKKTHNSAFSSSSSKQAKFVDALTNVRDATSKAFANLIQPQNRETGSSVKVFFLLAVPKTRKWKLPGKHAENLNFLTKSF